MKKVTEDKYDVIRFLEKLYIGILENNIKVPDECHIEMYSKIYLGFLYQIKVFRKSKKIEIQKKTKSWSK